MTTTRSSGSFGLVLLESFVTTPPSAGFMTPRFRKIPLVLRLMFFLPSGVSVVGQVWQDVFGLVKQLIDGNEPSIVARFLQHIAAGRMKFELTRRSRAIEDELEHGGASGGSKANTLVPRVKL